MVKVKFNSNWDTPSNLKNRVISNFINESNYTDQIIITDKDDYDYLICFNSLSETPKVPKENIYTFIMEPSWTPSWDRNCFNYSNKVFCHDKNLFGNYDNIVETPSLMFYHMTDSVINDFLKNNNFEKPKLASMVVSYTPDYYFQNYSKRTQLALKLLEYNFDVDIYGNGWIGNHKNIKGPLQNKIHGLLNYKFSICVENSNEKNYITEKYFDVILCNSNPIYCGAPNIREVYNHSMIIDIENLTNCLDLISDYFKKDVDIDLIRSQKKLYFEKYNLYSILKQLLLT